MPFSSSVVYRFGAFELDRCSGELRKNGKIQKIQDQPLQVLIKLLDHAGETVTRDDLRLTLWPADTYVGFETGLNTAIRRLREVLGDSTESPNFVGTVPKRGYRFLAAVNKVENPLAGQGCVDDSLSLPIFGPVSEARVRKAPQTSKYFLAGVILLSAIGAGFAAGKVFFRTPLPTFRRLTFRRGYIPAARFTADSRTIIYAAAWDGGQPEIFSTRSDSPESRPLDLGAASLLAVSNTGQMAIARAPISFGRIANYKGTMAQTSLAGGATRDLLDDVLVADWDSVGKQLAVVRVVEHHCRLEFPVGRVLYESKGFITNMRISPSQRLLAFLDHPRWGDDLGSVVVLDLAGKIIMRSSIWETVDGLAWPPGDDEVWFTAAASGAGTDLYGITLSGRQRVIKRIGARLVLQDISPDFRVLLTEENERFGITAFSFTDRKERDLSWLDYSFLTGGFSPDGKSVIFSEESEASGPNYAACIRKLDGSQPVRLGEGLPSGLSPDGKWVLSVRPSGSGLLMLPTGSGEAKSLETFGIEQHWGLWFPDGQDVLVMGRTKGRPSRTYIQSVNGGPPKPLTPEGVIGMFISPDGKLVLAAGPEEGTFTIYTVEPGMPRPVMGIEKGDLPIQWSRNGASLYVRHGRTSPQIYQLNLSSGRKEPWETIVPADPAGLLSIDDIDIDREGRRIVYGYARITSELYVVDGLR